MKQLKRPEPVEVQALFAEDRAALIDLLRDLTADEWTRPTSCAGWTVHDVAAHILGGDLGNISLRRDRYIGLSPGAGESFVAFINRINAEWIVAARRLSPRLLTELLEEVGPAMFDYFASLDPLARGAPVSWAGDEPAPVWLDVAREYTERWHHQQHIRDAVGRPGQTAVRFLRPALATYAHALPVALAQIEAPERTAVTVHVEGEAGGAWSVVREGDVWTLYTGEAEAPAARVTLREDDAWRLYTRGLPDDQARGHVRLEGDRQLAERVLGVVAIVA